MRERCRAYAQHWVDVQKSEFQALGVLADWDNAYQTMDSKYEADTLRVFGRFAEAGLVEWKLKTVPWCAFCQTTLSKSEMDYVGRADPSLYVSFDLTPDSLELLASTCFTSNDVNPARVSLVAWTTTPWTLPFNRALVLSPKGQYVLARLQTKQEEPEDRLVVVGAAEFTSLKKLLKLESAYRYFTDL